MHRAPSRQYYLLLITVVKKLKMKKQDFFCQICVIGGISIEVARAPWAAPLASPMILR